jgi:transcriptional regulator with XRE-family HTH domain
MFPWFLLWFSVSRHVFKVGSMTKYVARTIKDRMKAIGMRQAWLAEKVGVSIAAVSKWTTDGKVARDNVPRVAEALGLTTDQLLGTGVPTCTEATLRSVETSQTGNFWASQRRGQGPLGNAAAKWQTPPPPR